jgi:hypothetical protein
MKIILEFDNNHDAWVALKARNLLYTLDEFRNVLRTKLKHENLSETEYKLYDTLRDTLWGIIEENKVDDILDS